MPLLPNGFSNGEHNTLLNLVHSNLCVCVCASVHLHVHARLHVGVNALRINMQIIANNMQNNLV